MPTAHSNNATTQSDRSDAVNYAIVGGGVAGAYVAWRIACANERSTVNLYEATPGVGGRLLTTKMPGMPFWAELGGMRYSNRHLLLASVIDSLNLPSKEFNFDKELMYLRGRHFIPGEEVPYRLVPGERGKRPDEVLKQGLRCALREVTFGGDYPPDEDLVRRLRELDQQELGIRLLTARQWEFIKRYGSLHGSQLNDVGFWNLLQYYLSDEGFLYTHDGLGYESIVGNWNAAEAVPWFLRDIDVTYRSVDGGMQIVPTSLEDDLKQRRPGSVHLSHCVDCVRRSDSSKRLLDVSFANPALKPVRAEHVVLALPKRALKDIDLTDLRSGESFDLALESVTAHSLFKLFLGYDIAWWEDHRGLGGKSGKAITDLPVRQVYYWGPDKAYAETRKAMLMASYSDAHYVDFWRPLHRRLPDEPYYYIGEEEALEEREKELLAAYGVSPNMARKAHRQVKQLHPQLAYSDHIPDPYVALVKDWSEGWHTWNVRSKPWRAMQTLRRPFEANVYVCGEAFSSEQGWIEGALRSAEAVLKQLGIPEPAIPTTDYTAHDFSGYEEYIGLWGDLES